RGEASTSLRRQIPPPIACPPRDPPNVLAPPSSSSLRLLCDPRPDRRWRVLGTPRAPRIQRRGGSRDSARVVASDAGLSFTTAPASKVPLVMAFLAWVYVASRPYGRTRRPGRSSPASLRRAPAISPKRSQWTTS
uniref:Uncharacterized protein n=1 Tax=Triticum urartu TaxID=4572 RepID=A0A8R7P6Q0_TRIUA